MSLTTAAPPNAPPSAPADAPVSSSSIVVPGGRALVAGSRDLGATLLRWEGAPDTEFFRSITWAHVHALPASAMQTPDGVADPHRPGLDHRAVDAEAPLRLPGDLEPRTSHPHPPADPAALGAGLGQVEHQVRPRLGVAPGGRAGRRHRSVARQVHGRDLLVPA